MARRVIWAKLRNPSARPRVIRTKTMTLVIGRVSKKTKELIEKESNQETVDKPPKEY